MPPKTKNVVDDASLPVIDRTIVKIRLLGAANTEAADFKQKMIKSKRKEVIVVTREKLLDWAEAAQLYINPDTWDPKKKMPEGIPTIMNESLQMELYYIDNVGTRNIFVNRIS